MEMEGLKAPTAASRRADTAQRPGTVLTITAPSTAPPTAQREPEGNPPNLGTVTAELAKLRPVFEEIARAQSFNLIDSGFAGEWARLSKVAAGIRRDLETLGF